MLLQGILCPVAAFLFSLLPVRIRTYVFKDASLSWLNTAITLQVNCVDYYTGFVRTPNPKIMEPGIEDATLICLQGSFSPDPTFTIFHLLHRKDMLMKNRSRNNKLTIYLSDREKTLLEEKTKLSGLNSMSAYLRNLIIYGFVYDVDYTELHEYSVQLSRIGSRINQIAKQMNMTGKVYEEDVNEVKELMDKIWLTHESMLSKQPLINR